MFTLNKIILIGNLGNDAETSFTTGNHEVTKYSLATVHSYKKNDDYEKETTWHNIVSWNLPDFLKNGLKKGKKFYVEGRLSKREYTDKEGNKRLAVEVISDKIIPLQYHESHNEAQPDAPAVTNNQEDDDLPF